MPLIQGGPPQWVWERTADPLKWEVAVVHDPQGHSVYELRVNCSLEIVRLEFVTEDELKALESLIGETLRASV